MLDDQAIAGSPSMRARRAVDELYRTQAVTVEHCVLCAWSGRSRSKTFVVSDTDRYRLAVRTLLCSCCGFSWSADRLNDDAASEFYRDHYRDLYHPAGFSADDLFDEQQLRARPLLEFTRSAIERIARPPHALVVLDVGCGSGGIGAHVAEVLGATTIGLDLDKRFLDRASQAGVPTLLGELSAVRSGSVDVVIASHVLEHVNDLLGFIAELRRVLRPDGVAVIEVPSIRRVGRVYGRTIEYLQSAHLWNFDRATLTETFAHGGMQPVVVSEWCMAAFTASTDVGSASPTTGWNAGWRTVAYLRFCDLAFASKRRERAIRRAEHVARGIRRRIRAHTN